MKKALLFGFNHYVSQSSLRGCVNDAVSVERLLRENFNYQTRLVIDEPVNSQRFVDELVALLAPELGETDGSRVLYYAGHGFHCYDVAPVDEADGLDELLCLPGYRYDDAGSFVVDDQIGAVLDEAAQSAPWMKVFVVFDSCHSGTAIHGIQLDWSLVETIIQKAFRVSSPLEVTLPIDDPRMAIAAVGREAHEPLENLVQVAEFTPIQPETDAGGLSALANRGAGQHLLLSGCSPNQTCKELAIEGTYHGIFSYLLCKLTEADPAITWSALAQALNKNINPSFDQNPQLEGSDQLLSSSVF
ncbi:MAG: caspase family protein [Novosphingobium sp.]